MTGVELLVAGAIGAATSGAMTALVSAPNPPGNPAQLALSMLLFGALSCVFWVLLVRVFGRRRLRSSWFCAAAGALTPFGSVAMTVVGVFALPYMLVVAPVLVLLGISGGLVMSVVAGPEGEAGSGATSRLTDD
mgnify:CR=1 FL=1